VAESVIPVSDYDDTFRRQFIDTAGKIIRHADKRPKIHLVLQSDFKTLQVLFNNDR
jgi:hypothetical protein